MQTYGTNLYHTIHHTILFFKYTSDLLISFCSYVLLISPSAGAFSWPPANCWQAPAYRMPSIAKKKGERNNKSSHRIIFKSGKIQQPTHCTAGQGLLHDIYWVCTYIYVQTYISIYAHGAHHVHSVCSGLVWHSGEQRHDQAHR